MRTLTYAESRAHYAQTLDDIVNNREELVITRAEHEPVVMLALHDYESLKETAYLLRNPSKRTATTLASIESLEHDGGVPPSRKSVKPRTLSGDESLELPEFDSPPPSPIVLLQRWLASAENLNVREPRALVLSTADTVGHPSGRVVLLKDVVDNALVFTTNSDSKKGRDLAENPWAAMTFYWRETLQQVTVSGRVERLLKQQSDVLFAARPLEAQVATAVSSQSHALLDEAELQTHAQNLVAKAEAISRPEEWFGYRLIPETIEFFQGRSHRLHRRLEYIKDGTGWSHRRLQP